MQFFSPTKSPCARRTATDHTTSDLVGSARFGDSHGAGRSTTRYPGWLPKVSLLFCAATALLGMHATALAQTPPPGGGGTPPPGGPGGGPTVTTLTSVTIGPYQLHSSRRYSEYLYDYFYTTSAINSGSAATSVLGTVTSSSANTVVISGTVNFGNVAADSTTPGTTTFTIRQDRRYSFDPTSLTWTFTGAASSSTIGTTAATVTLTSTASRLSYGTPVTLTASVAPTAATGTVTFYDGPVPIGTGTLSSGAATLPTFVLPTGTHQVLSAGYSGDTTYAASSSTAVDVSVAPAGAARDCAPEMGDAGEQAVTGDMGDGAQKGVAPEMGDAPGGMADRRIVCLATAFEQTLTASQIAGLQYTYTLANVEHWSNLPIGIIARNGLQFGSLSSTQLAAALQLAQAALSHDGYTHLANTRGSDNFLSTVQSGMGFGATNYYIAFYGTPSTTSPWMLQIGGHHFAFNHTYNGAYVSGTPFFIGVEPPIYTVDGKSYWTMEKQQAAMYALSQSIYGNSGAVLSGTFDDVVMGVNGATAIDTNYPQSYPTGTTGRGVLASSLSPEQQGLIKKAIEAWVNEMDSETASALLRVYEDKTALANTYVGYSGDGTLATKTDYIRIDGPRIWIEFCVQQGIVFTESYHYHTIWRDKTADYGGDFL